jgi:DNA-binding GntR family transcriptional regulator
MSDLEIYRTIPEQIAARIRQDVLSGKFKPGDPLREAEVSERFGVSRGPIREALRQLTQQGLLVLEPNKGVRVAPNPNAASRPLIVELRRSIERHVLDNLFDRITEEHIASWDNILADILDACERGDTTALVEHDLRFHRAIIMSHEDKDFLALWEPIMMRMLMHYNRLDDLMESFQEHKNILDAIRESNKSAALQALENNIQ